VTDFSKPTGSSARRIRRPSHDVLVFARGGDTLIVLEALPLGAFETALDRNHPLIITTYYG